MTAEVDSLAELDLGADEAPPVPAEPHGPGLRALAVGVVLHPAAAFRSLAEHPGRRWAWPLLTLVILNTILALVVVFSPGAEAYRAQAMQAALAQSSAQFGGADQAQMAAAMSGANPLVQTFQIVGAVIGGVLVTLVTWLVISAVLHLVATILGGQQSFSQMFTVITWAAVPVILGLLLKLVFALFGNFDPSPAGLSGLVAPAPGAAPSLLAPFLGHLELWNLWSLVLFVPAIQAASRIPRRKAMVAVGLYLLLNIAVGLVGTFIAGSMMKLRPG